MHKKTYSMILVMLALIFLLSCTRNSKLDSFVDEKDSISPLFVIDTLILKSNVFNNTRKIRVLLPPNYYLADGQRYPVLYLNDGILVFHAYDIENIVHELIDTKRIEPLIIVGIDNGASTFESKNPLRDRANEYLPWPDEFETNPNSRLDDPHGRLYPDFLFNEVMPMVDSVFRTKKGAKNTGLGGSSRGALISLYTAQQRSDQIDKLLLESPSLYVANHKILNSSKSFYEWPGKVYVGIGAKEGATTSIQNMALTDAIELKKIISKNSITSQIEFLMDEEGEHSFEFFAKRFPKAIEFLYAKEQE